MNGRMSKNALENLLKPITEVPVECDGFTRLAATILSAHKIDHTVMVGALHGPEDSIPLHYWIECEDFVIDYRARMWLGNDAPHGVFQKEYPWKYAGKPIEMNPLDPMLFQILSGVSLDSAIKPGRDAGQGMGLN